MTKTANYNLNKPEATDPLRLADFNGNADIIDAALGMLNGRAKVVAGSFIGDGNGGYTLPLDFTPRFAMILSRLNSRPYLTIATPGEGFYHDTNSFSFGNSRCVEGGVYIASNANNSREGNYYLAVE